MVLLGLLFVVVAVVLGTSTAFVLWPVLCVGAALLYCVPRPRRRNVRLTFAAIGVLAAIAYRLGPWHVAAHTPAVYAWFAVPLVVGALIVLAAGGPKRIRARHERLEEQRRRERAELIARTRAAKAERGRERRDARRDTIRRKTGLDVGLFSDLAREKGRKTGERVSRRMARHRPPQRPTGPPDLLDLDQDVDADLSRRRSEEILRLADQLDATRRPRPRPR